MHLTVPTEGLQRAEPLAGPPGPARRPGGPAAGRPGGGKPEEPPAPVGPAHGSERGRRRPTRPGYPPLIGPVTALDSCTTTPRTRCSRHGGGPGPFSVQLRFLVAFRCQKCIRTRREAAFAPRLRRPGRGAVTVPFECGRAKAGAGRGLEWSCLAPSSRGLGHHPLKVETRVRTPLGLQMCVAERAVASGYLLGGRSYRACGVMGSRPRSSKQT